MNKVLLSAAPGCGWARSGLGAPDAFAVRAAMLTVWACLALAVSCVFAAGASAAPSERAGASGDSCSNAAIRAEQRSTDLPDCRAYEMVSPVDKSFGMVAFPTTVEGHSAGQDVLNAPSSDGDALAFSAYASFADPTSGGLVSYRSTRSPAGWNTQMWSPKTVSAHAEFPDAWVINDATEDLKTGWTETGQPFNSLDQDHGPSDFLPARDVYKVSADDTLDWQSRPNGEIAATERKWAYAAGHSADGSVSLFQSTEALVPEAAGQAEGATRLYKRAAGVTSLVGVEDNGDPVSSCGSIVGTYSWESGTLTSVGASQPTRGSVSRDASRIFFSVPDPYAYAVSSDPACLDPVQLYVRDGSHTIHVSASQRSTPDTPASAIFQGAAADGSRVVFMSSEALTDSAPLGSSGMKLYAYDVKSGGLTLLSDANVQAVPFVSQDGSRVYYVQDETLKLSVNGASRAIAAVGPAALAGSTGLKGRNPSMSASPDGGHFLYLDDGDATHSGAQGTQAYLYSENDDQLICISCGGELGYGTRVGLTHIGASWGRIAYPDVRSVTDDGKYAFFDTTAALVPQDDNDTYDVYRWHDGEIRLVSDGRAADGAYLLGVGDDGHDVFFSTEASLVSSDTDNGDIDFYDARVEGGFAEPAPAPKPCSGDQCQGPPTGSVLTPVLGSVTFAGAGDVAPPERRSVTVSKLKTVTGTTATLRVAVASAGSITLTGRSVGKATKKSTKAGTYSVKVKLTAKARASLKKGKTLKVAVTVAFKPSVGASASKKVTLTFKQPKGGR